MAFGLIIIGDEILSGKRQDKHFARVREILAARGLRLSWVAYLGDDRPRLADTFRRTLAGDDVVFSCGGIGATPDDHTRQAVGEAAGVPLALHPEARRLIEAEARRRGSTRLDQMLLMGEFPAGAEVIPNPCNGIPGFSLGRHHFVPGFPEMAWPMLEWVLDTRYRALFQSQAQAERAMMVRGLTEGSLTPLMEAVEREFPGIRVFSLPRLNPVTYEIELGVKGTADDPALEPAFQRLRQGCLDQGGQVEPCSG